MRYCTRCVQPDTRPGLVFSDDGLCGACLWEDEKKNIDWAAREDELRSLCARAKSVAKGPYQCVVGVSGGKDSTYQALYARDKLGLKTLLVNGEPDGITEIGRYNIENLKNLGFDVVSLRPNPKIVRKLVRKDFFANLNPVKATEYSLWASAYIIAGFFNIPLVIQGENAGQTLGVRSFQGTGGDALSILDHNTLREDPLTIYLSEDIHETDLFLYKIDKDLLLRNAITAIWLSYYDKDWSQPHNAAVALEHGLRIRPENSDPYELGTYRRHSQLDGSMLEVNQMLKHVKFGFGQATDHVCYDIRGGLLSRDEGIFLVRELDGLCGDKKIADFCKYIGIREDEFWKHANTFRGKMWSKDPSSKWILENPIWQQYPIKGDYSVRSIMERLGS